MSSLTQLENWAENLYAENPHGIGANLRTYASAWRTEVAALQQRIAELTAERDRLREAIEDGPCSCRIVDIEGRMCNAPFLSLHSPNCWKREALEGGKS